MNENNRKPIKCFQDLDVFRNSYYASLKVINEIIPKLPKEEMGDLGSQMRRSCKAVPRLIAEGYAKRHQKRGFQKYLNDSSAESNEMIVNLNHCKDLYPTNIDVNFYEELIDIYDKTSRQLYNLSTAWNKSNRNIDDKRNRYTKRASLP